ncbi:hypothetical protein SAMN05216464_1194 [Mucilaginibacter pineti]|uniref:Uncharacterized protein n=1 Tax=Mucilaginibacter pineti TaxID=1391627 RepID=A0A1G7LJK1_9SPHI|nr:hypothetical protein SAMN05216464_1194 [Mucilaginibacter pineti]
MFAGIYSYDFRKIKEPDMIRFLTVKPSGPQLNGIVDSVQLHLLDPHRVENGQ